MLFATAITTIDTTMTVMDWTRDALAEGLISLGYWENANSRRLIRFLESDRFKQFTNGLLVGRIPSPSLSLS